MKAPPKEKSARREPDGKAIKAYALNNTRAGDRVKLPETRRVSRSFKDTSGQLVVTIFDETEAAEWQSIQ